MSAPAMHREAYVDRLDAQHAGDVNLVTDAWERAAARGYVAAHATRRSFPCASCGRHCFPSADVVCFWCRRDRTRAERKL